MKKIFLIIFLLMIFSPAFAEEDDWGNIMTDINKSTDFGKIISNTDYKNAIQTKENYIKKNKKKSGKKTDIKKEEPLMFDAPDSQSPLLLLPTDVWYENTVIKQGFYLVNLKIDGGKYFLELRQGNSLPVSTIEATGFIAPGKTVLKPQVSTENVNDNMIKINYSGENLILESVLRKN